MEYGEIGIRQTVNPAAGIIFHSSPHQYHQGHIIMVIIIIDVSQMALSQAKFIRFMSRYWFAGHSIGNEDYTGGNKYRSL